uniref:Uncharacterized protein n=1 Tax=Ditylenchus dipsaci TaxID=166011 RepID=A0A915D1S4_9BILA
MDGTVYQSPDIYTLVQSRLVGALDPLRNALGANTRFYEAQCVEGSAEMEEDQSESDSASTASMVRDEEKGNNNPSRDRATAFQRTRTDMLLKVLVDQFPPQNMASESASRNKEDSRRPWARRFSPEEVRQSY